MTRQLTWHGDDDTGYIAYDGRHVFHIERTLPKHRDLTGDRHWLRYGEVRGIVVGLLQEAIQRQSRRSYNILSGQMAKLLTKNGVDTLDEAKAIAEAHFVRVTHR